MEHNKLVKMENVETITINSSILKIIAKAIKVAMDVIKKSKYVLKDPLPTVAVAELGDSSVNLLVRPWVNTSDYWGAKWELTQQIKEAFDKEGISIPFPQRDVHLFQEK